MLKNIPKSRILLYIVILGFVPLLFVVMNFFTRLGVIEDLESNIQLVQGMALDKVKKQTLNEAVIYNFREVDHFYIDKHLESLRFLKPEVASLKKLINNPNFAGDETILKRLEFLNGSKNSLLFSEGSVTNYPQFQENIGTLVHPVEVNIFDIQNILARLEGREVGLYNPMPNRPQIVIIDFNLEKKQISQNSEVFDLNMKILKREFL